MAPWEQPPSPSSEQQESPEYNDRSLQFVHSRVQDMLHRYHAHRVLSRGVVDSSQWKLLKEKNLLTCYKHTRKTEPGEVPDLLAVGSISGSLEDIMHGIVNLTPETMQIENAYTQGDLLDSRILATIIAPTAQDPFMSMSLKWVLHNHASISRHRDYVYLEATGFTMITTKSADGQVTSERMGYHVVQSVSLPSAPEFNKDANIIRGHLSYCYLYRQAQEHTADVYFYGNMNPLGGIKEKIALNVATEAVLSTPSSIQYALMKKLAFSLRAKKSNSMSQRSRRRTNTIAGSVYGNNSASSLDDRSSASTSCAVCTRQLRTFFTKSFCELCDAVVCSRCRMTNRVYIMEGKLFNPIKMEFCTECVATTNNLKASWVATQELIQVAKEREAREEDGNQRTSGTHSDPHPSSRRSNSPNERGFEKSRSATWTATGQSPRDRRSMSVSSVRASISRLWHPVSTRVTAGGHSSLATTVVHEDEVETFGSIKHDDDDCPIIERPSQIENDELEQAHHAVDLVIMYPEQ